MSNNKLTSIIFIIPYIGTLPNYFQLWLNSCAKNPTIDFLLFTDDKTKYHYPENVKVHYTNFIELRKKFQQNFDFPISLNKPYKFCDFKPTFGEVFSEYITGYDFWGHCDIDLIFGGGIREYFTEEIFSQYNRLMTAGHCCLYKNKPEINAWYKTMPANGFQNWKDVFTTNEVRAFDEWGIHCGGGISYILESNGIKSYSKRIYADVSFEKGRFFINGLEILQKYKQGYFVYENGHIYFCDKDKKLAEFMYVHFQKRAFKIDGDIKEPVYFIAPGFITSNKNEICKKRFFDKIRFETTYWLKRIKRKLYHILIK